MSLRRSSSGSPGSDRPPDAVARGATLAPPAHNERNRAEKGPHRWESMHREQGQLESKPSRPCRPDACSWCKTHDTSAGREAGCVPRAQVLHPGQSHRAPQGAAGRAAGRHRSRSPAASSRATMTRSRRASARGCASSRRVRLVAPRATIRRLDAPPVLGAALLGLDRLLGGDTRRHAAAVQRLRASLGVWRP